MVVTTRQFTRKAREYLYTVKNKLEDNRETYAEFLKVLKDFGAKRIGRTTVRSKVRELFKNHQELIVGFNKFLPDWYKITLEREQSPLMKLPKYREAVEFIKKVKARLQNDRAYGSFLEILHMYRADKKTVAEVYHEVFNVLLRDHHDLRVEFVYFLPRYM